MEEKYIRLIDRQIRKLSDTDFDLEAWKGATKYVLRLIFGEKDIKVSEIEELRINYSSWALRDSASDYNPVETCKKKGREILEVAKSEIELFELIDREITPMVLLKPLLTESQYETLTEVSTSEETKLNILKKLKKEQLADIVLHLL